MSEADKKIRIDIQTTADTDGARKAVEAIEGVVDKAEQIDDALAPKPGTGLEQIPADAKSAATALEDVEQGARGLEESIDRASASMREFVGFTKEEQAELKKLQNLVSLSESAVASQQKNYDPSSPGSVNGRAGAQETLASDRAAVLALKEKVAARLAAAKATQEETAATKDLTAETKRQEAAEKERAKEAARRAKEERDERRAEEQALDVKRIKYLQIAQGVSFAAAQFGGATQSIRDIAKAAEGVDKELSNNLYGVATGFESIHSAVQGAASGFTAGGAGGAILGGITGLAAPGLKADLDALVVSLNGLATSQAASTELPKRIEAVKKALLVEAQTQSWNRLRDAIGDANEEVRASQALAETQRNLNQFYADEAVRVAKGIGADDKTVREAEANAAEVRRTNAIQQSNASVAASGNELSLAQSEYQISLAQAEEAARTGAANQKQLAEEAERLREAMEQARLNYEVARSRGAADTEKANTTAANDRLISDANNPLLKDAERKAADKTKQLTDEILARIPDAAEPGVQEITARIQKLVGDGQQQGEVSEIDALLNQLAAKMERNNTGNREIFQKIITNTDAAFSEIQRIKSILDEQARAIKTLNVNQRGF